MKHALDKGTMISHFLHIKKNSTESLQTTKSPAVSTQLLQKGSAFI